MQVDLVWEKKVWKTKNVPQKAAALKNKGDKELRKFTSLYYFKIETKTNAFKLKLVSVIVLASEAGSLTPIATGTPAVNPI